MRRIAYLFVFLILITAALAADRRPHSARQLQQPQKTRGDQQQLSRDNRGTQQAPFIVKTLPPEKSQDDIHREEEKAELDRKTVQLTGDLVSYTWLLFIATAALAFATGGLALVAFFQMRDARKAIAAAEGSARASEQHAKTAVEHAGHAERAIKVAEESAERQLRAYVWAQAVELHNLQVGALPYVVIEVRNAGQTPAYQLEVVAGCLVGPYPLPPNSPFPMIRRVRATKMVLHPGPEAPHQAIALANMNLPNGLDAVQVTELQRGNQMRLFVFCLITYKDAFDKERETRLCVSVDATDALRGAAQYNVNFAHDVQHNSAT